MFFASINYVYQQHICLLWFFVQNRSHKNLYHDSEEYVKTYHKMYLKLFYTIEINKDSSLTVLLSSNSVEISILFHVFQYQIYIGTKI